MKAFHFQIFQGINNIYILLTLTCSFKFGIQMNSDGSKLYFLASISNERSYPIQVWELDTTSEFSITSIDLSSILTPNSINFVNSSQVFISGISDRNSQKYINFILVDFNLKTNIWMK